MADAARTDLEELERFVAENDDLFALEEIIGRFNVFDALGVARAEIRHSNFLAWLLNPHESHGQGDLFLKALLMDMFRHARRQDQSVPISPVVFDGAELRDVEIRREWRNIDLLIACKEPAFVVAIENKVDSGEHSGQLGRYEETVRGEYPAFTPMFIFLTPDGDNASGPGWTPYSYANVHRVLMRIRKQTGGSLGADVSVFLDHYLNLIGSRFMNDPAIKDLCRRIYANHRRAIELIMEHAGSPNHDLFAIVQQRMAKSMSRWRYAQTRSTEFNFVPSEWPELLPPISNNPGVEPWEWLVFTLAVGKSGLKFVLYLGQTTDEALKSRVVEAIMDPRHGLGLSVRPSNSRSWRRLLSKIVCEWEPGVTNTEDAAEHCIAEIRNREPWASKLTDAIRSALSK